MLQNENVTQAIGEGSFDSGMYYVHRSGGGVSASGVSASGIGAGIDDAK